MPKERPQKIRPGFLVTFDGIEGSGKSTQLELLAEYLAAKGRPVLKTREPGGTSIGNAIRAILLDPSRADMVPKAELFLILASRAQHIAEVIRPAIAEGKIVLCDRFVHATIAYQGYGRGLASSFVESMAGHAAESIRPRVTFLLDLDVSIALDRLASRGELSRIDRETLAFHGRVREGYLKIANKFKRITRRIDAARPIEAVAQEIREQMDLLHV